MANPVKKIIDRIGVNWFFLSVVIFIYTIVAFFDFSIINNSFGNFGSLLWQVAPVILIVFSLVFIFNLFVSPQKIIEHLGEGAGRKGWLLAIVLGIISSGPIYMWYPLLKDLKEKGMRQGFMVCFLYNRAIKIPLLSMMIFYFGWLLIFILNIYMIIFSVINGYLLEKIIQRKENI